MPDLPEMPDIDLMGYMPDHYDYLQIIPIQRETGIWFHVIDTSSGHEMLLDMLTALKLSGRLTYLTGRLLQDIGKADLDQKGPCERETVTRAMDDPTDERWQRETYRRPKN